MYSLFLLLSTWVIPGFNAALQVTYFLPLLLKRFWNFVFKYKYTDKNFILLLIIILSSQINLFFSYNLSQQIYSLQSFLTFTILTPLAYLFCRLISINDLKYIIYFITIECFFVFYESFHGISTIYPNIYGFEEFKNVEDLIYFNRPYGLSNNASGVAEKLLIGFLLISLLGKSLKNSWVFLLIFSCALIINFGRTAIISVLFFYFMNYSSFFLTAKIKIKLQFVLIIFILFLLAFFTIDSTNFSEIVRQFTRGNDSIDLSGRDEIWDKFFLFVKNNFLFGNHSAKLYLDYSGNPATAHNSFLMGIATHGIIIFSMYLVMLVINLNKYNFKYVFTIILFSMAQYAIFWGISFMDIFYLFFLTSPLVKRLTCEQNKLIL